MAVVGISPGHPAGATDGYQAPDAFVAGAFNGDPPPPVRLWLKGELRNQAREILGHEPGALRVTFWGRPGRTAWILDEIGKEQPITVGIIVDRGRIESLTVLAFRESRGWEVRYPFFTDQFRGRTLAAAQQLDQPIDGISGATLSVSAVTRLARLALLLHGHSGFADDGDP